MSPLKTNGQFAQCKFKTEELVCLFPIGAAIVTKALNWHAIWNLLNQDLGDIQLGQWDTELYIHSVCHLVKAPDCIDHVVENTSSSMKAISQDGDAKGIENYGGYDAITSSYQVRFRCKIAQGMESK